MNVSLRLRVTFWSTAANGLALLVGVGLLFWLLDQQLTGALDEALVSQARLTAMPVARWLAAGKGEAKDLLGSDAAKSELQELFTLPRDVPSTLPTMISLLDAEGQMVLATHSPNNVDLLEPEVLKAVRGGAVHRAETTMTDASDHEQAYRVATVPVRVRGRVEAFVQVLVPLQNLRGTLARVQSLLGFSAIALLLLNAWLVSLALKRAMRPVDALVTDIHRITERNLSVRIPVPTAQDELRRLSETFNAMLDRLDQGFQFQTRLFQDLSHQLKTPLAILTGTLETALSQGRSAGEYQSILESNLDDVSRMTQLIENLLLLARMDSQQMVLQLQPLELAEFCRMWSEDFALLWQAKSLRVVWESSDELSVWADPGRLGQALLNLLDNAVKHSPEYGMLTFRFTRNRDRARLELLNQGPPVVPGSEETIFLRFSKGGGEPGFGLGLPIARAAVELHGGTLTAFQPTEGGAGFRLELPLRGNAEKSLMES